MGHRLAVMNKGEVVQLDTPEKVFNEPAIALLPNSSVVLQ